MRHWSCDRNRNRLLTLFPLICLLTVPACGPSGSMPGTLSTGGTAGEIAEERHIVEFCSKCHQPPDPASFPKNRWVHEVYQGYRFFAESNPKSDIKPPEKPRAIDYYTSRAPETLPDPEPIRFAAESSPRFRLAPEYDPEPVEYPMISFLSWKKWTNDGTERLVMADMSGGTVSYWDPESKSYSKLASIPHPSQFEWSDIDQDGVLEMVVADLGSVEPADHDRGNVYLLKQQPNDAWSSTTVASGLGRVCEVRTADFNGDGRLDIVVAEFGWHKKGGIRIMEQRASSDGTPRFQIRRLDERHGAIRVPPVDLDQDGDIDFVALIAQEYEAVEVFVNRGDARFDNQELCPPREPAFGLNGLEAADLDGDGDIDFVVTNGDMFDNFMIKPYHQLRWLENLGSLQFADHHLACMPGVCGAAFGDLDLDGDLDIVTSSCFPLRVINGMSAEQLAAIPSAIWFEQTEPGKFSPHPLEFGNPLHASQVLADVDSDGDLDIVLGLFGPNPDQKRPPFTVYENLTRSRTTPTSASVE
ncbi:FG-GAP repeat domain-containing protein [Schlesneria sp.]|uniref:FG-GAP repeat domain-containing protein n=1 Tax=Schlesneria sp. TaxID=2762018 RepID=UPI002F222975